MDNHDPKDKSLFEVGHDDDMNSSQSKQPHSDEVFSMSTQLTMSPTLTKSSPIKLSPCTPQPNSKRRRIDAQKVLRQPFRSPLLSRDLNSGSPSGISNFSPKSLTPRRFLSNSSARLILKSPTDGIRTESPTSRLIQLQSKLRTLTQELETARQAQMIESKKEEEDRLIHVTQKWKDVSKVIIEKLYEQWKEIYSGSVPPQDGPRFPTRRNNSDDGDPDAASNCLSDKPLIPAAGLSLGIFMNEHGIDPNSLGEWDAENDCFL